MSSPWSDERIARRATALLLAGNSSSQVASTIYEEFGCYITRNAVIGFSHRVGLRASGKPGGARSKKRRVNIQHDPIVRDGMDVPHKALTLYQLTEHACRWPFGDGPFSFCGEPAVPSLPYCLGHARIAYIPRRT